MPVRLLWQDNAEWQRLEKTELARHRVLPVCAAPEELHWREFLLPSQKTFEAAYARHKRRLVMDGKMLATDVLVYDLEQDGKVRRREERSRRVAPPASRWVPAAGGLG